MLHFFSDPTWTQKIVRFSGVFKGGYKNVQQESTRLICEISLYFTWNQKANNTISNIIIDTGINNDNKFVQILRKNFHVCITLHAHAPHPKNIGLKQSGNEVSDSRKYCWKYYS